MTATASAAGAVAAWLVFCLAPVAYVILLLVRGREYRFPRTERYLRDPEVLDLTPAQVGYAWRMGHVTEHEINATILDLVDRGVIAIAETPGRDDTELTLADHRSDDLRPHEAAILKLLFDGAAEGGDSVTLSRVAEFVAAQPGEYADALQRFKMAIVTWAEEERVFEPASFAVRSAGEALGIVTVAVSLVLAIMTGAGVIFLVGLPLGFAMLLCAPWMLRESRPAARTHAQAEALRRYLHDFGRLDDMPPAGVVLWGRYLVYAELFGLADAARTELRRHAGHQELAFGSITWTLDALPAVPLPDADRSPTAPPSAS